MGLDFGYTCGTIDDNINSFKSEIEDTLDQVLDEVCPVFGGKDRADFVKEWLEHTYKNCELIFEDVRKCNEDMRSQAELQISDLEREKEELEEQIGEKDDNINDLQYELGVLEGRVRDLENENTELLNGAV